jgi:hypothetical protein
VNFCDFSLELEDRGDFASTYSPDDLLRADCSGVVSENSTIRVRAVILYERNKGAGIMAVSMNGDSPN